MQIKLLADSFYTLKQKVDSMSIRNAICSRNMRELRAASNGSAKINLGQTLNRERVKDLSPRRKYLRKKARNQIYQQFFKSDPDFQIFIDWIKHVQKRLGMTNLEFARALGFKDSRMLMAYYKKERFPSEQTYVRLLYLERQSRIKITEVKNVVNIKNKGISKKIEIPSIQRAAFRMAI